MGNKEDKELEKENVLDKLEGKPQEWRTIVRKGNTHVCGLYKNYVGWEEDELAEIRIKFEDNDDE